MKKIFVVIVMLIVLAVCAEANDMEAAVGRIEVGYGKPTADGIISENEYSAHVTLDYKNMKALTTVSYDVPDGHSIEVYFSWDNDYLYVAYNAVDVTPCPSQVDANGNWLFNGDNIQFFGDVGPVLAYRELLDTEARGGRRSTIFAVGMNEDDTYFYLHQLSNSDSIINLSPERHPSASVRTENGWTAEIAIPWKVLITDLNEKVEDVQISEKNIGSGAVVKAFIVYNDMETPGTLKNMFGTTYSDYSQPFDWQPEEFGIELLLTGGESDAEPVPKSPLAPADSTSPDTGKEAVTTEGAADETTGEGTGNEENGNKILIIIISAAAAVVVVAAVLIIVIGKKKK